MAALFLSTQSRTRRKLPMQPLFRAPEQPVSVTPIRINTDTSTSRFLVSTMFRLKKLTIPAMFLRIGHQICEALVPVVAGKTVDIAIASGSTRSLWAWIAILLAVFLMLDICSRFAGRLGALANGAVRHSLLMEMSDRILDRRGFRTTTHTPGALLSIATTDASNTSRIVMFGIMPVAEVAALIFSAAVLLTVSVPIGLIVLIGGVLLTWGSMLAGRDLRQASIRRQAGAAEAASTATDLVTGFRTLAGLGARRNASRRYTATSRRYLDTVYTAINAEKRLMGSVDLLGGVFVIVVAVGAAFATIGSRLTIGQLITVVGLAQFIIGPMTALGKNASTLWAQASASASRVIDLLREPYAVDPEGVTFVQSSVDDAGASTALRIVDEVIAPGQHRVFGRTAGEIANFASAVSLQVRPQPGRFAIIPRYGEGGGEIDLADADLSDVLQTIIVSPHDSVLFDGTVVENLRAVNPSATALDIDRALIASGCADVIQVLPKGLDTRIGEGGVLLSGGQRQRVALARALVADPEILVLENPTTAVDSVTEYEIARAVAKLRRDKTTIVLTSSPAWRAFMEVA